MKRFAFQFLLLTVVLFSCKQLYPLDLGKGYKLDYDPNSYFFIYDSQNNVIVDAHVVGYRYDSTFIVAKQRPNELILKDTYTDPQFNLEKRVKLLEESPIRYYWIINKNTHIVYGPLQKPEYIRKQEELLLSKNLNLQ